MICNLISLKQIITLCIQIILLHFVLDKIFFKFSVQCTIDFEFYQNIQKYAFIIKYLVICKQNFLLASYHKDYRQKKPKNY